MTYSACGGCGYTGEMTQIAWNSCCPGKKTIGWVIPNLDDVPDKLRLFCNLYLGKPSGQISPSRSSLYVCQLFKYG